MSGNDYGWAVPVMRAGYAGRGLTYLAVAGLSLWAIWRGGEAQGTQSALRTLEGSALGVVVLGLIALGLLAYAVWRLIDAAKDLEAYGSDGKGLLSRAGMIVTGIVHGAIGVLAVSLVLGTGGQGGGSGGLAGLLGTVLSWPAGRLLVGAAAIATIGAGIYYVGKGWKASYRKRLAANQFTRNYDWALRAGVIANGVVILIIGGFLGAAALNGDPQEAGGLGQAFDWLATQPFGNALVLAICLGLLGFSFFCFVNAAHRIVPRAQGYGIENLGHRLKRKAAG